MSFRLTYATMFNPPEEMHERFEKALAKMRGELGKTHPMYVDGKDVPAATTEERASPIDNRIKTGRFPHASTKEVDAAIAAAERAFPAWRDAGTAQDCQSVPPWRIAPGRIGGAGRVDRVLDVLPRPGRESRDDELAVDR